MGNLTDDQPEELEYGEQTGNGVILQTEPGTYVLFPQGVAALANKFKVHAILVEPDGDILVLREGLGDKYRWVSIVDEA